MEIEIVMNGRLVAGEPRQWWATCYTYTPDGQRIWWGGTGTHTSLVDALSDAKRVARRIIAAPEMDPENA